jgi:cytochrome c biogenesis protein
MSIDEAARTAPTTHEPERPEAGADRLSTAPAPLPPAGRRTNCLGTLRRAWRQLTSMRTALLLLALLALAAVPGSLLPQRGLNAAHVASFYAAHPTLAPILDKLFLFDVFAAPWFAAIYLLLFVSLGGCLARRIPLHVRSLRARPPKVPRNLAKLGVHDRWETGPATAAAGPPTGDDAEDVARAAARLLRGRRFRVDVHREPTGAVGVCAEKGYLRETGNLVFHVALVVLLAGVALTGLFGYKGNVLVPVGDGFSNTLASYDDFHPGRLFSTGQLAPFSFTVEHFHAAYLPSGEPKEFDARIRYRTNPKATPKTYDDRVNHPLSIGGTKLYLLGHGYSPMFRVVGADGKTAYDAPTPFLPQDSMFTSTGVVKVPGARPQQLGFSGVFFPTLGHSRTKGPVSKFPAARDPAVALTAYHGDLGLDSGLPQSVYDLDFAGLRQYATPAGKPLSALLHPGDTMKLPGGGSITFTGVREWATFQVTHDPGALVVLIAAIAMIAGLLCSLWVRRRRLWVRVRPASNDAPTTRSNDPDGRGGSAGRTVVEAGGLARTDADGFAEEFRELAAAMRERETTAPGEE